MTRTLIARIALVAALALPVAAPSIAQAQNRQGCDEEKEAESGEKNYRTVRTADGRKVFVIERAFVVCGKVPKPQVIYVLHQRSINYEWENLKKDFLPKVLTSVKKAPF